MSPDKELTPVEHKAHLRFAADLYNHTWQLLDKPQRTAAENELMLHAAHGSAYHWLQVGKLVNFQRSAWQLARVYTVLGDKEKSLHYAKHCHQLTIEQGLKDFDLAFALEAMARAHALNGNRKEYEQYKAQATQAGEQITEKEDKEIFFKDIGSGPWFGME